MSKLFSILVLLAGLTYLSGCIDMPSDLMMPQWDVDLNLPIASKSYIMDEIVKSKTALISINPTDSLYMLKSDDYSQSVGVGDLIKLKTESSTTGNYVPLNSSSDVYLAFPEGAKLKSAVFQSGKIRVIGRNPGVGSVTMTLTIPGITKNNLPYQILVNLPSGNYPVTIERDISGWTYNQPAAQPTFFEGQMWFQVSSTSQVGDGLNSTFDIFSTDFEFNSVTGYFPRRTLSSKRNSFALDLGDDVSNFRDRIFLSEASLNLNGKYISQTGNPFKIKVSNFKVLGIRKNGQQIQLKYNDQHDSTWSFDNAGNVNLPYDQTNSNVDEFVQFIPDSIAITGDYILNPDNNTAYKTVNSKDSVSFTANFQTKSIVAIKKATVSDLQEVEFNKDDRDQLENGLAASLTYEIESKIPLNIWAKVVILDANKNKLFAITRAEGTTVDSILINSAQVNNGKTTGTLKLDSLKISQLSKAYYTDISFTVETTNSNVANPQKYPIYANDWVKMKTYGSVKLRVKEKK